MNRQRGVAETPSLVEFDFQLLDLAAVEDRDLEYVKRDEEETENTFLLSTLSPPKMKSFPLTSADTDNSVRVNIQKREFSVFREFCQNEYFRKREQHRIYEARSAFLLASKIFA